MARLELAGTAARATGIRARVADHLTRSAIFWDFWFIVGYVILIMIGAAYFPARAYRVRKFRGFAVTACVLAIFAGVLDAIENIAMLRGLASQSDLPWQIAATVSWAKWLILIVVVGYVLLAAFTFLITSAWVQDLLLNPPPPNVTLTPAEAQQPEDHVRTGTPNHDTVHDLERARFGIAASGGGIRSASLVLGSLQALDDAYPTSDSPGPSWATADKIASVSGGSYISGGISVARSERRALPPKIEKVDPCPDPATDAWRPNSPEETHLLSRLGYLLAPHPSGQSERTAEERARVGSDAPGVIAMVLIGLALNVAVLFSLMWMFVQPYGWLLKSSVIECRKPDDCAIQPHLVFTVAAWGILAVILLVTWVGAGWVRAAFRPTSVGFVIFNFLNRRLRAVLFGVIMLTGVLAALLIIGPALVAAVPDWLEQGAQLLKPAAVIRSVRYAPYVAGFLFAAVVVLVCVQWLISAHYDEQTKWVVYLSLIAGWVLFYTFVSAEWWSIAGFYRARLRLAFATYRDKDDGGTVKPLSSGNGPVKTAEPSIYELMERRPDQPGGSPLHICATAHASTPEVRTHYGLPAMSVTISPDTVRLHIPTDDEGGWTAYQVSTGLLEALMFRRAGSRLTTMLAVAVSGAAVSPAMGAYRIGPARAALAVANVRLGVWIPNPKYAARYDFKPDGVRPPGPRTGVKYPRPRLGYLLKELFGVHDPNDLYIYITDAGQWENTGLVELIRDRNIDEVVCLDADEKPRETATEIAIAIGLAKLECNADVQLDLDPLRGPYDGRRGTDYSPQSVALGVIRRGSHLGLLWYAKPVLTKETPLELLSYAECDESYHDSTIDQFFHTAQFKAYRDLGRHNGREVVRAREALSAAMVGHDTYAAFRRAAQADTAHWAAVSLAKLELTEVEYGQLRDLLAEPSTFAPKFLILPFDRLRARADCSS